MSYGDNSRRGGGGGFSEENMFGGEFSVYNMVQRRIGLPDPSPSLRICTPIFFGYKTIQIGYVLTLTGTGHFFVVERVFSITGTGILSNRNGG